MTADEYVPSDDDVRIEYVLAHQGLEAQLDAGEAYDRWLAAHDARVRRDAKAEALREIAPHLNDSGDESFLMDAADRIEAGDSDDRR